MNEKEPIWNAKNINRKIGDTTFEICGWCNHRGCGSCRYDCLVSGYCNLIPKYHSINRDVNWDTPCKILLLGKDDVKDIVDSKKRDIQDSKYYILRVRKEIGTLNKVFKAAKNKPPLPDSRKHDYYNVKEAVWVFHNGKWSRGIVTLGYRHHDGCVSYVLDDYPESATKGPWGCGTGVPQVLKDWEFKYFKSNKEDWKLWCIICDKKYNGEKLITKGFIDSMED